MKITLLLLAVALGCSHPQSPLTLNPLPPPEATAPDVFTNYIADCSDPSVDNQGARVVLWVQGCLDSNEGYDVCMAEGVKYFTKDALVCTTIDLNVEAQREIARDTATGTQKSLARVANPWIRNHRIGARQ
jgi:hypothetical protein